MSALYEKNVERCAVGTWHARDDQDVTGRGVEARGLGCSLVDDVWISACEPPPPRPFCKPLGPPAPLVAIPLEVVQGPTQLVVAGPDLAKELLNG